ncbi:MAG TPA: DUF433 domain-containing protein [Chloroflexota bacterium]|jgi:uncharacterized protein (DUF433 family)
MSVADTDALIEEQIEENPYHRGPGDVRLRHTAVPVWALVNYWRVAGEDAERTAADYEIPLEAMQAALAYYRRNPAVIDARIVANAA